MVRQTRLSSLLQVSSTHIDYGLFIYAPVVRLENAWSQGPATNSRLPPLPDEPANAAQFQNIPADRVRVLLMVRPPRRHNRRLLHGEVCFDLTAVRLQQLSFCRVRGPLLAFSNVTDVLHDIFNAGTSTEWDVGLLPAPRRPAWLSYAPCREAATSSG